MPTARDINETKHWLRTARTLSEALPYMRRYAGATFVIKFGGNAMGDGKLAESFARDIVLLKQVGINPVVVHGGGPQIGRMLERLQITSEFVDGLRVTDAATVEVVEMVLAGSINKQIVSEINAVGGVAVGLSGKDGNLITAAKLERGAGGAGVAPDLGFVGYPKAVNPQILELFAKSNVIPVVAPIAIDEAGQTYNINADTAAGAIAAALNARRFYLLTDVAGVLDADGVLIDDMPATRARALVADGTATGGMIPKIETCLAAIEGAVEAAVIIDGRVPHALLLEVFTERGVGTLIYGG
jgi:acetylglutamate kinase